MSRNRFLAPLIVISFMASCATLLGPVARLADPMTHRPLRNGYEEPFPVLIVSGDHGTVQLLPAPHSSPRLNAGESFLVPDGRRAIIERQLAMEQRDVEGGWTIDVTNVSRDLQRIELYWVNDGYFGGVYEATSTSVRPLYRKITGPGFAFVFGSIALGMNLVAWAIGVFFARRFRAQKRF